MILSNEEFAEVQRILENPKPAPDWLKSAVLSKQPEPVGLTPTQIKLLLHVIDSAIKHQVVSRSDIPNLKVAHEALKELLG